MAELFATIMLQVSSILLSNEDTCAYRRVYLFNFLKKEMDWLPKRLQANYKKKKVLFVSTWERNSFSGADTNTFTVVWP